MDKSSDTKKKKHRGLRIFIRIQLILMLMVIAAITYYYVGGYASEVSRLHDEAIRFVNSANEKTFRSAETSIIYTADGEVLSTLKGEKDVYYLDYKDIPIYAKEAIISIEDKKYYDHKGVDFQVILRAGYAMVRNGKVTQGASTITQQLARNIFLSQEKTWQRKVEEIYIAVELDKRFSKNQILEYYLNNIYFANGYYGVEAASRGYFNMPCSELSLSQIAYLCAIPNSPSRYDPVKNPSSPLVRRNLILQNMYEDGIISEAERDEAMRERIELNIQEADRHDYQETYTFYCATRALMSAEGFIFKSSFNTELERERYLEEYNSYYEACNVNLYKNGYRIYTSLDNEMQEMLQETIDTELADNDSVNSEGIYELQGAGVCIDNETGFVTAIVGGRSQEYEGYTLNRAFQSFRQPGSAIKPLIVYAPALEMGYSPNSVIDDSPIPDGPENSGGGYSGEITFRRAVELSKNIVAWKIFEDITPKAGLNYLKKMEFSNIKSTDEVPSAALGGFTKGVSSMEMAGGFATLQNDGFFRRPTCIVKITDSDGNAVYRPSNIGESVYKQEAARQMTDILRGVLNSGGATGAGLRLKGMDAAGKTGTTNENKDGWFVGYTPYYTTAVWVGYDNPKPLSGLWGSTMPGRIWKSYMNGIHEELEYKALNIEKVKNADEQPEPVEALPEEPVMPSVREENVPADEEETQEQESPLIHQMPSDQIYGFIFE